MMQKWSCSWILGNGGNWILCHTGLMHLQVAKEGGNKRLGLFASKIVKRYCGRSSSGTLSREISSLSSALQLLCLSLTKILYFYGPLMPFGSVKVEYMS